MELTVQRLTKKYRKKTAVSDVSLVLTPGIYGLLVVNGAGRKIKTYSGEMKQRLGIAQAELNSPSILILDEQTFLCCKLAS